MATSEREVLNNISTELKDSIKAKRPKRGQTVQFRLCNKIPHPNKDRKGEFIYPGNVAVRARDVIFDPYKNENVTIGVVDSYNPDGSANWSLKTVTFPQHDGYLLLTGGNVKDDEWFDFLMLSNQNASNPNRFTDAEPMYYLIDHAADAAKMIETIDAEMRAGQLLMDMNAEQQRNMAISFGFDENETPDILRVQLYKKMKADPEKFSATFNDKNLEMRAVLGRAINKGIIGHLPEENKMIWVNGGETVASLTRSEGQSVLEALSEWVITSKNGMEVYNTIKNMVNPKVKK